jgi:hypothetical protein
VSRIVLLPEEGSHTARKGIEFSISGLSLAILVNDSYLVFIRLE